MEELTYGALALLPPLVAILFAMWKKQVIVSLLAGIWGGATIINNWNPLKGLLETFSNYIVGQSLADSWNIGIIVFLLAVGGMIGMISKMGGTKAIADSISAKARDVRSTQLATALMGVAIFFDDYANSIIVGNTMRPITDKQKISREKLSYIVDSSAAPVSSMAPISTWIAMELGLIAAGLQALNIEGNSMLVFFQTIPYRFYSIFSLIFLFVLIGMKRDFGPMLKAEIRARKTGDVCRPGSNPMITEDKALMPTDGTKGSVLEVIIPIGIFILITFFGLWYNGYEEGMSFRDAMGNADASVVLTWAAFVSSIAAGIQGMISKKFSISGAVDAWIGGAKSMLVAVIILALAFALKAVISEMQLAEWLVAVIPFNEGGLAVILLPTLVFPDGHVRGFLDRYILGDQLHSYAHRYTCGSQCIRSQRFGYPSYPGLYRKCPYRGGIRRPLLSYLRYNHPLLLSFRSGPYRPCTDTGALCPDSSRPCRSAGYTPRRTGPPRLGQPYPRSGGSYYSDKIPRKRD